MALTGTIEGTVAPWLAAIRNPLALLARNDGSVLVSDWSTGTIYRIAQM